MEGYPDRTPCGGRVRKKKRHRSLQEGYIEVDNEGGKKPSNLEVAKQEETEREKQKGNDETGVRRSVPR